MGKGYVAVQIFTESNTKAVSTYHGEEPAAAGAPPTGSGVVPEAAPSNSKEPAGMLAYDFLILYMYTI